MNATTTEKASDIVGITKQVLLLPSPSETSDNGQNVEVTSDRPSIDTTDRGIIETVTRIISETSDENNLPIISNTGDTLVPNITSTLFNNSVSNITDEKNIGISMSSAHENGTSTISNDSYFQEITESIKNFTQNVSKEVTTERPSHLEDSTSTATTIAEKIKNITSLIDESTTHTISGTDMEPTTFKEDLLGKDVFLTEENTFNSTITSMVETNTEQHVFYNHKDDETQTFLYIIIGVLLILLIISITAAIILYKRYGRQYLSLERGGYSPPHSQEVYTRKGSKCKFEVIQAYK